MRLYVLTLGLLLSACGGIGHLGGSPPPCVTSITRARTMPEVVSALQVMGVEKGLATKTAEALMTSRLSPSQVCDSLKR